MRWWVISTFLLGAALEAQTQYIISTVAGSGETGDGGPVALAWVSDEAGVAVDGAGNLYVAEPSHCRVRRVTPAGIISTYAGTGVCEYGGDGGPATAAKLKDPWGLATDGAGNLYIADRSGYRIRKVTPAGTISTIAGDGTSGFAGDGGPAVSAKLSVPWGVAADPVGNVYVADTGNYRVRRITPAGIISTVAGNGTQGDSGDGGPATSAQLGYMKIALAADAWGNLYIADGNRRIRMVTPSGIISTVAGTGVYGFSGDGGPATSAQISVENGVAADAAGNLYIADAQNSRIRKVNTSGIISTIAGNGWYGYTGDGGPATAARLAYPNALAVDATGNIYVTCSQRVRRINAAGIIDTVTSILQVKDGGPATQGRLAVPEDVAVDATGNLYIADTRNLRVRRVTAGGVISTVAGTGEYGSPDTGGPAISDTLQLPTGVALDGTGGFYIADLAGCHIYLVTAAGVIVKAAGAGCFLPHYGGDNGPATSAKLFWPHRVAADGAGGFYIADTDNHRVRWVNAAGTITTVAGTGVWGFSGDGGPATAAQLFFPYGLARDTAGNLYIADRWNCRIRKVTPGGIISTVAGTGVYGSAGDGGPATAAQLGVPSGVAVDGSGAVFIADSWNHRIRRVSPAGTIDTIAGTGIGGFSGDSGPARLAQLNEPGSVVVDAYGNLYVADTHNDRIRKLTPGTVACAFLLPATSTTVPSAGGAFSLTLIASAPGCAWTASSNAGWIQITSGASGSGNGMVNCSATANPGGARSGTLTVAGQTFTVNQAASAGGLPSVGSVSPANGAGASQTFTFTFSDPNGWQDLGVLNVLINFWLDGRNSCYLAYSQPYSVLYLVDDAGTGLSSPLTLGGAGSVSNSQCTIYSTGSAASGSANTLTLTLNIGFAPGYAGSKLIYMAARDVAENNSGWQRMGAWTVPGAAPTSPAVVGMSPARGSGSSQTFTFQFSDTDGYADLGVLNVLVNDWLDGRNACYLAYSQTYGVLYLVNDAGTALSAPLTLGGGGSVSNSQCTIYGTGSSASGAGSTLALTLNMSFASGFAGNRAFYLAARDALEHNSGWQAMGTWTVP